MTLRLLVLTLAAATAPRPAAAAPEAGADPAPAAAYETRVRAPRDHAEKAIASERVSFDPALDCVAAALARRAPEPPDPRRYRHALPVACGSPLYVVEAIVVPAGQLRLAQERIARVLLGSDPIALGTARMPGRTPSIMVVAARRIVELAPFPRDGSGALRGRLLMHADRLQLYQATARGVRAIDVPMDADRRFEITPEQRAAGGGAADVDLELEATSGKKHGPQARIRVGAGGLAVTATSAPAALDVFVSEIRRALGESDVAWATNPGGCDAIPAKAGAGVDVTDRAACVEVPLIGVADLPVELAYRAALRAPFLDPQTAIIEVEAASVSGPPPSAGVAWRALRVFETLTPDRGRARVFELLRRRWPSLAERRAPAGTLEAIVGKLRAGPPNQEGMDAVKPEVARIAAHWSKLPHYWGGSLYGRDLDAVLDLVKPAGVPRAADVALGQARGADGMLRHFVVVILEIP